jgi:fucose permease
MIFRLSPCLKGAAIIITLRDEQTGRGNHMTTSIRKHLPYTLTYYFAFILLGLTSAALGPALPNLAQQTSSALGEIGLIFTAASFGFLLGSLSVGRAYDRLPGNRLLAFSLLIASIGLALIPRIDYLWLLTGAVFLMGLGQGALDMGANLLLVWVHRARATPYLNGLHFFFGVGALSAPLLIAQSLLHTNSITPAFSLMALVPLPAVVYLMRLPSPSTPAQATQGDPRSVNLTLVALLSLVFALYVGAEVGFGNWIYTYAIELGLGNVASAAYLTSGFWGALMTGRLLIIPIAARFSPQRIILADFAGCLISLGLILWFPHSSWIMWLGALGLGLSMASIFPTLLAYAEQHMTLSGQATRWFFVGTGAGGMILPWLMGQLFAQFGALSVMWAVLLDLTLGLAIFAVTLGLRIKKSISVYQD